MVRIFCVKVILAVLLSWFIAWILTVTNAMPDDPDHWAYGGRTDVRIDALTEAPWIRFPYPGICQHLALYSSFNSCIHFRSVGQTDPRHLSHLWFVCRTSRFNRRVCWRLLRDSTPLSGATSTDARHK